MIPGIDVSHWEGKIDWVQVARAGYRFAFCKASESNRIIDDTLRANIAGARANGLLSSPYHFYRVSIKPQIQAAWFLEAIKGVELDLPPVLDFEDKHDLTPKTVAGHLLTWLELVEAATGKRPLVYSSAYYWQTFAGSPAWSTQYQLWVANYTSAAQPLKPKPWATWAFWQYSDSGTVPGVQGECDLDWFTGDEAELYALAGKILKPEVTHADIMSRLDEILALLKPPTTE